VGIGVVIVIRLQIEIWVIGKGGTKRSSRKEAVGDEGAAVFCGPYVLGCISTVAVEGACVRDYRELGCVQLAQ
jgi:hypothetical protein